MSDFAIEVDRVSITYPRLNANEGSLKELLVNTIHKRRSSDNSFTAVRDAEFKIEKGSTFALVGHNGSGKSTLLKAIAGVITPSSGSIHTRGRIAPMIELGAGFDPELTGRENVFLSATLLGLSPAEIHERVEEIKAFSDLDDFFEVPVKTYSSGMYMRLGFSCSTAIEPEVLLIDEILAVGDANFHAKCMKRIDQLRSNGCTVVVVSHDPNTVRKIAEKALVLRNGISEFLGDTSDALRCYENLLEEERAKRLPEAEKLEAVRKLRLKQNSEKSRLEKFSESPVKIIDTVVENSESLRVSENIKLNITIETKNHLEDDLVIGFAIHTKNHLRITGSNTKNILASRQSKLRNKGRHEVQFHLSLPNLASGEYIVVAAVHDWKLEFAYDFIPDACRLKIRSEADANNFDEDIIVDHDLSCFIKTTNNDL